jgi:hypothetical protein
VPGNADRIYSFKMNASGLKSPRRTAAVYLLAIVILLLTLNQVLFYSIFIFGKSLDTQNHNVLLIGDFREERKRFSATSLEWLLGFQEVTAPGSSRLSAL